MNDSIFGKGKHKRTMLIILYLYEFSNPLECDLKNRRSRTGCA